MAYVFFPSCKAQADYKEASARLARYIEKRFEVQPIGCCRVNHQGLAADDTAIVVCNNCAEIIAENTDASIKSLWEVIDQDDSFEFPDYAGEEITVQDCWIAFENHRAQDTVRSLLHKMNFRVVELAENRENTKFCGPNLLAPCTASNAKLAHKLYVERFPDIFTPMDKEQQEQHFRNHCQQITTKRVACYCKFCRDGINMGGVQGVHMLELLFPGE